MIVLITEPKDYSKKALNIYKSLGPVYLWSDAKTFEKKSAAILVIGQPGE